MTSTVDASREAYRKVYDGALTTVLSTIWGGNLHLGVFERPGQPLTEAQVIIKQRMADAAGIGPSSTVIEVACGVGGSACYLARERGASVLATNITETQLADARMSAEAEGLTDHLRFAFADYHDLSGVAADASFDCWWCQEALLYAADKRRVLSEARRVVRPGGRLVMTDLLLAGDASEAERAAFRHDIRAPEMIAFDDWKEIIADIGLGVLVQENLQQHALPTFLAVYGALVANRERLVAVAGEELVAGTEFRVTRQLEAARAGRLGWGLWVLTV